MRVAACALRFGSANNLNSSFRMLFACEQLGGMAASHINGTMGWKIFASYNYTRINSKFGGVFFFSNYKLVRLMGFLLR